MDNMNEVKNEVNHKIKPFDTARVPRRQMYFLTLLIWILSKILLLPIKHKVEKINMEGIKPPYIMLSNHQQFVDFEMAALATFPHRVNNVIHIDGYYRRAWLMYLIGGICKRKFTTDLHLLDSIDVVLKKYKDILGIYPEARYTPIGTTAILPDSLGWLVQRSGVPLVIIVHHGNYLHTPFWDFRHPRKVPLYTTMKCVLTAEQVKNMTADEINRIIRSEMYYNEYEYQKKNNIRITEPFRAQGLHKVLYQCPHCMTESRMNSKGSTIFCEACGKVWEQDELGELHAINGETEFSHVPDWFEWEREQVRKQVDSGQYSFEDTMEVFSLTDPGKFINIGFAKVTHDAKNGFIVEGEYNGSKYRIQRRPLGMYGLHVEYDHMFIRPDDCIDISTDNDSLYCYPSKPNTVTKLSFATEEIYKMYMEDRNRRREENRIKKAVQV